MGIRHGETKDQYIERLGQEHNDEITNVIPVYCMCYNCDNTTFTSVFTEGKYSHTVCVDCGLEPGSRKMTIGDL